MTRPLPDGVYPVMLTPFTAGGAIDYEGLDELVDWYLDAGVAGLFPVSQSSEMFDLSDDERLALAEHVVDRADVPVVATGTFGGPLAEQARFVERMDETGVDSVVVNAARIADADDDEATWEQNLNDLLDRTDADLGFYECPRPYHRTISPGALGRAADTGRFRFLKETGSRPPVVAEKVAAAEGTPLSVYVANATVLDEGLDNGARGYSGIAANVYPELLAWFCRHRDEPGTDDLERFITVADHAARNAYPTSAKAYVARTIDIRTECRVEDRTLTPPDERTLDALAESVAARRDEHGIPAPLAEE